MRDGSPIAPPSLSLSLSLSLSGAPPATFFKELGNASFTRRDSHAKPALRHYSGDRRGRLPRPFLMREQQRASGNERLVDTAVRAWAGQAERAQLAGLVLHIALIAACRPRAGLAPERRSARGGPPRRVARRDLVHELVGDRFAEGR